MRARSAAGLLRTGDHDGDWHRRPGVHVPPRGWCFAVSWSRRSMPDLQQTLGSYFAHFQAAVQARRAQTASTTPPRPSRDSYAFLVVRSLGHMRQYFGMAYVPALMPQRLLFRPSLATARIGAQAHFGRVLQVLLVVGGCGGGSGGNARSHRQRDEDVGSGGGGTGTSAANVVAMTVNAAARSHRARMRTRPSLRSRSARPAAPPFVQVPDVEVDTGSYGLRIISSV